MVKHIKPLSENPRKQALLDALKESLGIISSACNEIKISRNTHYRWMEEDSDYRAKVNELADVAIDYAEAALMQKISKGNTASIIFYLKTKGRKRGYIERTEITQKNVNKFEQMTDKELDKKLKKLREQ